MVHLELVVAKVVTVVLGLTVAVTAYRGYRRHGSWPMLYLAIGFGVISVGSVVEGIIFEVIVRDIFLAGAVQTGIVAVGMLVVLYSLHADAPLWGIGEVRDDRRSPPRVPDAPREQREEER